MSDTIKNILVPIDGSENSNKAARLAGDLARALGASITLLVVHDPELFELQGTPSMTDTDRHILTRDEVLKIAEDKYAEPAFESAIENLRFDIDDLRKESVWGHAAEEICKYAKDNNVDHIIMGSRGRGTFKGLLLGSVSSQVLHHASVSVTICRS
jgi:nucleotide-binding universal stress UspA family protein